ncbi:hypothetical protein HPB50_015266 [Hyalomma asiaticum]|uniref:Uncharacterized protein n=1 Tax=Hyalomma asiaticum TaxID=266040 RepID=A0ACB7RPW5_HYAAI|nr:hypothetical protein HPB50_015266 [Hyalomma asiaticum]
MTGSVPTELASHAGFGVSDSPMRASCDADAEDVDLVSSLGNKGVHVDMTTYVSVDKDVPTCIEDTLDTLIEEVLKVPLEATQTMTKTRAQGQHCQGMHH